MIRVRTICRRSFCCTGLAARAQRGGGSPNRWRGVRGPDDGPRRGRASGLPARRPVIHLDAHSPWRASRTKNRRDINVGDSPLYVAITSDGKAAFVADTGGNSVSTIDVASRTKNPRDITVGESSGGVAITRCSR